MYATEFSLLKLLINSGVKENVCDLLFGRTKEK